MDDAGSGTPMNGATASVACPCAGAPVQLLEWPLRRAQFSNLISKLRARSCHSNSRSGLGYLPLQFVAARRLT